MKITIYELLRMIKDGKAPEEIKFEDEIYEYYENDDFKDYRAYDSYFDGYVYLSNYIERNGLGCIVEELEVIDEG